MGVSIAPNNPGPAATTPQQALQDTQHQSPARPGPSQATFIRGPTDGDPFLISPQVAAQNALFPSALSGPGQIPDLHNLSFVPYAESLAALESAVSLNGSSVDPARDLEFFSAESGLSTPSFLTFPDSSPAGLGPGWVSESETASTHSRRSSRRISNGILDKVAKFEALGTGPDSLPSRPCTPHDQTDDGTLLA